MATDLEIIKQLEKELGIKFKRRKVDINTTTLVSGKPLGYIAEYEVDKKKNVVKLIMNITNLKEIPLIFFDLKRMRKINLGSNKLKSIPPEIKELKNLNEMILGANNFTKFPKEITKLKKLKALSLWKNNIKDIPKEIMELINLRLLSLSDNNITVFPKEILKLKKLETLFLDTNKISKIPPEIGEMKNLLQLELYDNNIKTLPREIFKLENLLHISLEDNKIRKLPRDIIELNTDITYEEEGYGISLMGNPLEFPPIEIVKKGRSAIIEYFKSLEEGESLPLNEVKVLLVGDGGSGKTSLMKQMFGEEFDPHESQTHGINIRDWKVKEIDINVHFWDFGGQEIMHATHQFFLSKRSLYVLVLDGRKEERPEYWLKNIESFGGTSPILVVLNKMDEHPSYDLNRRFL